MGVITGSILEMIKNNPDHVCIVDPKRSESYTYKEFGSYAKKIAQKLIRLGINKGDFVTIELPRNKEYIAAMFGIWLAGGAYVPLSDEYPKERIDYIRSDCNAFASIDSKFLKKIEDEEELKSIVEVDEESQALLVYTSGSTGKPKGVLHNHLSVYASVTRYNEFANPPKGFRAALGAPFSFIVSVQSIFAPLCRCLTEYIVPYEALRDPVLMADFLYDNKINRTFLSPKILKALKPRGDELKVVYTGSERVAGIYNDKIQLCVVYGQTETAAAILAYPIEKEYDNTPIGKVMGGREAMYVLDEDGNKASEGELCLAGHFATSYFNLPELSSKTFVDNPFYEEDGFKTLLKTGDLVKMREDGNIIFLNRKDWMVKINGQRVEPGEIEATIKKVEGVYDAVVKDFKNQYDQTYLVAYYVPNDKDDEIDIREEIKSKLPSYMLPAFFVKLDKLPVNANGKLDRSALKEPEAGSFKNDYEAPTTDMQKALCKAYEEVLGIDNVGIDDDFFAMGGDSIKCAMVSDLCEIYKISTADIFDGKTPRLIEANYIKKAGQRKVRPKKERARKYPLTPFERGMYIEQKINEDSTVYNLNIGLIINGKSADEVKAALEKVFAAHEAFCSFYSEEGGEAVRIVTDKIPEIIFKDADSKDEVIKIMDEYAVPFNLNEGIPVRPVIYKVKDGSVVLHMAIHHIAFDGGSVGVFLKEVVSALKGNEIAKPEIDLSDIYEDSAKGSFKEGIKFYKEMFEDEVPVNDMPVKGKRPKVHPLSDREIVFDLNGEDLKVLDKSARYYGITEFEFIFAAVSMVLGKYTVSEDVVLGIPTNMRGADANNVIGMFVNTAPVRVKPKRSEKIKDYLPMASKAVRNATYGATLPFEDVVAEFVKQRDESRNPIFDVSLNYMPAPGTYKDDELEVSMHVPLQKMSRDIGIVVRKSDDNLRFMVQYSSELFDDGLIDNFIGQIKHTLTLLEGREAKTLRDALAIPDNQKKVLDEISISGTKELPITLLHRLFEKSAQDNKDRTALIAVDETLTYDELDKKSNIVANNLIEKGIKVGDSVALLLPRESGFFKCLLGVNKAGAAFIPCDPQYPADRINHIIEDSEASFIITTEDKMADYPKEKAININEIVKGDNDVNPDVEMSDSELSYMIYTSGSTGKPKGVMLEHKGICNYLTNAPSNIIIDNVVNKVETYLSITTISFDMSFKEHMVTLCNGKTLVFAADNEMNDPRALARLMEDYKVDCMNATPSRFLQYMDYGPFREALTKCKLVMSGGEAYPMSLRDRIKESAPDTVILNTYGPTEITVSSNAAVINDADHISIGRPLLNYEEYIVDKFGDLAPYGIIGELYIGGPGVARGYKNLEEKTKEVFVEYSGKRMYRSGDYAKWDNDGNVIILGRLDNQVKLRGLRIELGEIIGLLESLPMIDKAAVVIRKLGGQENLCAYFTSQEKVDIDELRDELKKHLTHYMVPTAYLQMSELPMTANGKTDLKRLPEPVPVTLGEYVAPENDLEKFFCEAFRKALDLDKVGATDDFFEIGGTSLLVTAVAVEASENGYEITYGDIFKYTTPRALANLFKEDDIKESKGFFDFDNYDYTKIDKLLSENTIESFREGELYDLGNVMITGATGYMGAHLLAQFLDEEDGMAYCMLRKGSFTDVESRLKKLMYFYFEDRFEEEIEKRVKVLEGDVTDYKYFEQFESLPINTVFNCAANVKHFSNGTDIEDINVGGVVNCAKLCKKLSARLIHFSTISVSGTTLEENKLKKNVLDEQSLYFGQDLDNKYTSSKLMGERTVLEEIVENGLDGKVIRVGTLAAREADGQFQINFLTNNFMGRLRSYSMLGAFPYQMVENQVCMGPIDTSCKAFLMLSRTPKKCCMYNAVNNHTLPLGDIIRRMNSLGMSVDFVEYEDFADRLAEALKDPEKAVILSSMTAYMNTAHGKNVINIPFESHYTTQILARMGFFWNASSEHYVDDFINMLEGFRFFDKDNLTR